MPTLNDDPVFDFDSVRARLEKLAKSAYPEWSDHSTASFGNVMLDLYAYVADVLGFYIEAQGKEARLVTATQRENAVAIAAMLGYRPSGAMAAQAELLFTLRRPHSKDVTVPSGCKFKTRDAAHPVTFRVLEPVTIKAGEAQARGLTEASTECAQTVDASGAPGFVALLVHGGLLDGSLHVEDKGGRRFTEAPHLLNSASSDRHFMVLPAADGKVALNFGDGTLGAIPQGTLTVTYKTGGGSFANVEANSIVVPSAPFYDSDARPVDVEVSNPASASGGQDRESLDSIKANAPRSFRTAARSITREDFEINACRVPGVARALMLTSNEDARVEENSGRLYVVPHGGGQMTEAVRDEVLRMVTETYPCMLTFRVMAETAIYLPINIAATIETNTDGHDDETVRSAVATTLANLFAVDIAGKPNPGINFGFYARSANSKAGDVAWSEVVTAICLVPGVRKVTGLTLNGASQDVALEPFHFPQLGTTTLRIGGAIG